MRLVNRTFLLIILAFPLCVFANAPIATLAPAPYINKAVISQMFPLSNRRILSVKAQTLHAHKYLSTFFSVWQPGYVKQHQKDLAESLVSTENDFLYYTLYGMNFQPYPVDFVPHLFVLWAKSVSTKNQRGIVIRDSNLRSLPTALPIFDNYKKAGNGYPFDMNQAERLWVGRPVAIVSYTRDHHWAFISFGGGHGWIDARDVKTLSASEARHYASMKAMAVTRDDVSLSANNVFYAKTHIGQILVMSKKHILLPTERVGDRAKLVFIYPPSHTVAKFPIPFTSKNMMRLIVNLLGEPYDWGGYYGYRDCSLTMLSIFAPFGIWLPRTSYMQKHMFGDYHDVSTDSIKEKKQLLAKVAIPFATLIGLEGHVMLYLGKYRGHQYVFQDAWGLISHENGKKNRVVLGQEVVTPMSLGMHVAHVDAPLWQNVLSITPLYRVPS